MRRCWGEGWILSAADVLDVLIPKEDRIQGPLVNVLDLLCPWLLSEKRTLF